MMNCSENIKRVVSILLVSCSIVSTGCASNRNPAARADVDTMTTQAVNENHQPAISKDPRVANTNNPATARAKEALKREKQRLTLDEALKKAADYSWTIKVAKSQLDIAESRLDQAKAKYYPTVGAEITAPNLRYDGGITSRDRDFDDTAFAGLD
ncbi:MAG: TolC family protein, partial [Bifidobacteriales bacterium]|nr:TolC family protein [Bifidobacteriales bacterium]